MICTRSSTTKKTATKRRLRPVNSELEVCFHWFLAVEPVAVSSTAWKVWQALLKGSSSVLQTVNPPCLMENWQMHVVTVRSQLQGFGYAWGDVDSRIRLLRFLQQFLHVQASVLMFCLKMTMTILTPCLAAKLGSSFLITASEMQHAPKSLSRLSKMCLCCTFMKFLTGPIRRSSSLGGSVCLCPSPFPPWFWVFTSPVWGMEFVAPDGGGEEDSSSSAPGEKFNVSPVVALCWICRICLLLCRRGKMQTLWMGAALRLQDMLLNSREVRVSMISCFFSFAFWSALFLAEFASASFQRGEEALRRFSSARHTTLIRG